MSSKEAIAVYTRTVDIMTQGEFNPCFPPSDGADPSLSIVLSPW